MHTVYVSGFFNVGQVFSFPFIALGAMSRHNYSITVTCIAFVVGHNIIHSWSQGLVASHHMVTGVF